MIKNILGGAMALLLPVVANAASVNLSTWEENGYQGNGGAGTWVVEGAVSDSVVQTINGQPTVFFEAGTNTQGTELSGEITVETTGDDDFIGFVLGYQADEFNSTNADFWVIDWKQASQTVNGGLAPVGLALSHVTGDVANGSTSAFDTLWSHSGPVEEVARGATQGSIGWIDNQTYSFDLTFTDSLIEVFVDGQLEISHTGSFTDGAFGFYNFSQGPVRYAGITTEVLPTDPLPSAVPLPASLPLLMVGLGFFGFVRRRKT
jgi:hypothetical protein